MEVISFLIALLALVAAAASWRINQEMAHNLNQMMIRLDACERVKGVVEEKGWTVTRCPPKGSGTRKPIIETIPCSNEADAMRQLLARGVYPEDIISLEQKGA